MPALRRAPLGLLLVSFLACSRGAQEPGCRPPTGPRLAEFERLRKEGMEDYARYRPAEAIRKLQSAVEINPCDGSAWNDLGIAYNLDNQKTKAIDAMTRGLAVDPSFSYTRINLGVVYEEAGQLDDAAREFGEFVKAHETVGPGHRFLGLVEMKRARWEQAEKSLLRAVELQEGGDAEVWQSLGDIAERKGDAVAAEERYRKALAKDPSQATANYRLARLLSRAGRSEEAAAYQKAYDRIKELDLKIDDVQRALRGNPEDAADAHGALGSIYLEFGRSDKALKHFRESVKINPARVEALVGLAEALRRSGQLAEAHATARRALELKPGSREATAGLVAVLASGGKIAEAHEALSQALGSDPEWIEGILSRGLLEQQLGRWAEAAASFEKFSAVRPDHLVGQEVRLALYLNAADPKVKSRKKAREAARIASRLGSRRTDLIEAALR